MKKIESRGNQIDHRAAGAWVRSVFSEDIDEHTRQQRDWSQHYDQMDCGRFQGRFIDLRCKSVQVFVEHTTRAVRQRGHLSRGAYSFCMPVARGPLHLDGAQIGGPSLLMASENAGIELCTPPDCTLVGMVVDARELRETTELMGEAVPRWFDEHHRLMVLQTAEPALSAWRDRLLTIARSVSERPELLQSPAAQQQLHDELLYQQVALITSAVPASRVVRVDACKRLVDRACERLLSSADEPMSLLEVCREVGASPRKLGYCFQNTLGMSPARFIKITRLNAVRRELTQAQPGQTVYDIAARWGFWHFGHFSTDYKKQFAELPSETLRRARPAPLH
jgi:AraC family ethanolamine operon transcriptional activator